MKRRPSLKTAGWWLLVLLELPCFRSSAQLPPPLPDSLRAVVAAAPSSATILLRVAKAYLEPFDSAGVVYYARAAEQAAYQARQPVLAGLALDLQGNYYREAGHAALGLQLLQRAGPLLATASAQQQAQQHYHLGMAFGDLSQPGRALVLYREAARLGRGERELQANILNSCGLIYYRQNRLDSAAASFFRALRLTPGLPYSGPESATLGNLGLVYLKQQRWAEASHYFRRGKALEAKQRDTMALASSWQYLGRTLLGRDSVRAALHCLRLSARLAQRSHLANYLPQTWTLMGQTYQRLHQPDSARQYLLRAVGAETKRGAASNLAFALSALAEFYLQQQQWAAAERIAQQLEATPTAALHVQAQAWNVLRQVALHRRDYPAAYAALAQQQALRDSLKVLDNQQITELLRASFETDQAEAQVQALTREREVLQLRRQRQTLAAVLIVVTVLAAAGSGWRNVVLKQRANQRLQAKNNQIAEQRDQLDASLTELRTTQQQLIQKEKMASLGELTAGIAHEIQNPLNFVTNFAEVSAELVAELQQAQVTGDTAQVTELADDLAQNLTKIGQHGQRAAGIVRGMLEHSRGSTGERQPTAINPLCEEYLRLAYHTLQAKDKTFHPTLQTHSAPALPLVDAVPGDLGRVLLNLLANAFYAVQQRQQAGEPGYVPTISLRTGCSDRQVRIIVSDNGIGMSEAVQAKVFQPFFTTKPTGESTGLGLSLSYDIVTKSHSGTLTVESQLGQGSAFTISLPVA